MTRRVCLDTARYHGVVRTWAICLLAALSATGCDIRVGDEGVSVGVASGRADDEWLRTYTLPPDGALEIVNENGAIEVSGSAGPDVEVYVYREARAGSDEAAAAALDSLEIVEESSAERVKVEARSHRLPDARRPGGRNRVTATFRVRVPRGLSTSFRTGSGAIRLDYVEGHIAVTTANGSINGSGLAGGVSASVANGSVRLDLLSITHPTDVSVLNGSIRMELPADVKAELSASALNGRIRIDERFGLASESRGGFGVQGRIAGAINGGGPPVTLQTTNGAVRVAVRGSEQGAAPR